MMRIINFVYTNMVYNIWNFLGVLCIFLLVIFRKNRNAVWGGLTLGIIIGLVITIISLIIGNSFNLSILKNSSIVGIILGFLAELLGIFSDKFIKGQNKLPTDEIKDEISKLNFILKESVTGITDEEIKFADEMGLEIAEKAFIEIKKGNRQLGWIKEDTLKKIKETNNHLKKYIEKDGNLDFFFGFCFVVGREYGYGTPEKISKMTGDLVLKK